MQSAANHVGQQRPTAQPGTSCQIKLRLIHLNSSRHRTANSVEKTTPPTNSRNPTAARVSCNFAIFETSSKKAFPRASRFLLFACNYLQSLLAIIFNRLVERTGLSRKGACWLRFWIGPVPFTTSGTEAPCRIRVEACPLCVGFYDISHGSIRQPLRGHLACPIYWPEYGPALIPAAPSHSRRALAGHATSPRAIAMVAPSPSWSVLLRRIVTSRPALVSAMSATSRATSSDRRNAPAKPNSKSARSRRPARLSGASATIALTLSATAGAFRALAVPTVRLIPRRVALTASESVGVSNRASLWAERMAATRRPSVRVANCISQTSILDAGDGRNFERDWPVLARWKNAVHANSKRHQIATQRKLDRLLGQRFSLPIQQRLKS